MLKAAKRYHLHAAKILKSFLKVKYWSLSFYWHLPLESHAPSSSCCPVSLPVPLNSETTHLAQGHNRAHGLALVSP